MKVRTGLSSVQRAKSTRMEGMIEGHGRTYQLNGGWRRRNKRRRRKNMQKKILEGGDDGGKTCRRSRDSAEVYQRLGKNHNRVLMRNCLRKTRGSFRPREEDLRHMGGLEAQRKTADKRTETSKSIKHSRRSKNQHIRTAHNGGIENTCKLQMEEIQILNSTKDKEKQEMGLIMG